MGPSSSQTSQTLPDGGRDDSGELFQIIDETGEGFGFDLTPEALAKPLAIGAAALFSVGMLAGVPFGLVLGRAQEDSKRGKIKPSMAGLRFAATTFGLGTLLCASFGATAFYGVRRYYRVDSFQEFGRIMRRDVPLTRHKIENGLGPVLETVRKSAGENLPEPMQRLQTKFLESGMGKWIKDQVDESVIIDSSDSGENRSST